MAHILIWKKECWEGREANIGDLAIVNAIVDSLREVLPDVKIIMFSRDKEFIEKTYHCFAASLKPWDILDNLMGSRGAANIFFTGPF